MNKAKLINDFSCFFFLVGNLCLVSLARAKKKQPFSPPSLHPFQLLLVVFLYISQTNIEIIEIQFKITVNNKLEKITNLISK